MSFCHIAPANPQELNVHPMLCVHLRPLVDSMLPDGIGRTYVLTALHPNRDAAGQADPTNSNACATGLS